VGRKETSIAFECHGEKKKGQLIERRKQTKGWPVARHTSMVGKKRGKNRIVRRLSWADPTPLETGRRVRQRGVFRCRDILDCEGERAKKRGCDKMGTFEKKKVADAVGTEKGPGPLVQGEAGARVG